MHPVLASNLRLLATRRPDLAARMQSLPEPEACRVFPSKSGRPSLSVRIPEGARGYARDRVGGEEVGAEILFHSMVDPMEEARRYAAAKTEIRDSDAVILVGFGLGYHAAALLNLLRPDQWLLCIEPSEDVFRAALGAGDLSAVLAHPRTVFHVGDRPPEVQGALTSFLNSVEPDGVTMISYPACQRLFGPLCTMIQTEAARAVNRRRVELATITKLSFLLEGNVIRNIPAIARLPGVAPLFERFRGVPAFVVAAGPSLDGDLPHLAAAASRGLLICVGKTLPLLLGRGITPHIAVSIDPHELSRKPFAGLPPGLRTLLVFDPDSHPDIPAGYPGPVASCETFVPTVQWGKAWWGDKGFLDKGLTVAHAVFFLARALGADPIALIGVDLAFPGEQTHAAGVERTWGGLVRNIPRGTMRVPATAGGEVLSHNTFLSFLSAFDVEIAKTKARVVNCSGVGARIRGTEHVPLPGLLGGLPEIPSLPERIAEGLKESPKADLEGLGRGFDRVLAAAGRIEDRCERARKIARKLTELDPANRIEAAEIAAIGTKLQALRRETAGERDIEPFLQRTLSKWALNLKRCDKEMRALDPKDRRAVLRKEAEKAEIYFGGHADCVRFVREEVNGVLKALGG